MSFSWMPFVVLEELTSVGVKNLNNALKGLSVPYRIIDIACYGDVLDPRFAVVWAQRPPGAPKQWVTFSVLSNLHTYTLGYQVGNTNYYPVLVAAVGKKGHEPQFCVVLEEREQALFRPQPMLLFDLLPNHVVVTKNRPDTGAKVSLSQPSKMDGSLERECSRARRGVLAPPDAFLPITDSRFAYVRSIARYRGKDGLLYVAATFLPQPTEVGVDDYLGWRVDCAVDDAERDAKLVAFAAPPVGVRLDGIRRLHDDPDVSTKPHHLLQMVDNQLPGGAELVLDLSMEEYYQAKYDYWTKGMYPIRIDVFDEKAPLRVTALFAFTDEPIGRTFRKDSVVAPQWTLFEPPEFAKWDKLMETKMKRNAIRGGQMSITYNDKLVFTRAYTWAEPSYPDIQTDTSFCLGSVAKPMTALGFIARADQYAAGSLPELASWADADYWSQMGVTPKDPNLLGIKFKELLTHSAGLVNNQCTESDDIEIAAEEQVSLPLDPGVAFEWFANLDDAEVNTTPNTYCYTGTSHFLLSQWLSKDTGLPFADAMQEVVFLAAGAKHAHLTGQPRYVGGFPVDPKEALRHRLYPEVTFNHRRDDLPLRHSAYGVRAPKLLAPSAMWSMPSTDLARVLAALRAPSPLISPNAVYYFVEQKKLGLTNGCGPVAIDGESANVVGTPQVTFGSWLRAQWDAFRYTIGHTGAVDGSVCLASMFRKDPTTTETLGLVVMFNGSPAGSGPSGEGGFSGIDVVDVLDGGPGNFGTFVDLFGLI